MGIKDEFLSEILDFNNEGKTPIVEEYTIISNEKIKDEFINFETNKLTYNVESSFDDFVLNKPLTVSEILNVEKYKQFFEFSNDKKMVRNTITGGLFYLYAKGNLLKSLDFNDNYKNYNHYKECCSLIDDSVKKLSFKEFKKGGYLEHYDPLVFFTNKNQLFDILFIHYFKERIIFIPSSFNEDLFIAKIKYYRERYPYDDEKNEYMRVLMYFYNRYNNTYITEQESNFEYDMNEVLIDIIK